MDLRARLGETRLGPLAQVRTGGVAPVEVPHPAVVAGEGALIMSIRCPVQMWCPMLTETL